jgi:23S rRNA pseudouridine1911/1915/1917 synthase
VSTRTVRVGPRHPTRLDAFVHSALPRISRRLVRALIAEGAVRLNGRSTHKGTRVADGDLVEIPMLAGLQPDPDAPLRVLYEDDDVIAVDKPGGVSGHALDPRERGTVAGALLARYPELAEIGDPLSAGLVHRLDTGTSGVLLAARSPAVFETLRAAFRQRAVLKQYVAIVEGRPAPGTVVEVPLAHDPADRRRMRAARAGDRAWKARTYVAAVTVSGDCARLEVEIRTGVTHQVRAHLALLGHPILGDLLYGGRSVDLAPGRHALHAAALELPARPLRVVAPLPEDLGALLG